MSAFKDYFSACSANYAAYRPSYPRALGDFLADAAPATDLALDCGCGTGQLSVLLADRFERVIATDASAVQIASAEPHPRVEYRVAPAEVSGLPDASVDLVVAAQAAHWFNLPAFYAEARRVARPGAVVALVTYGIMRLEEPLDAPFADFYWNTVGRYWPPERRHVEDGYRSFDFPFAEFAAPPLAIEVSWTLDELCRYVDTWSAMQAAEKALGRAPVERFRRELAVLWGEPDTQRKATFPLSLRVGRV